MPPRQRQQQEEPKSEVELLTLIAAALAVGAGVGATTSSLVALIGLPRNILLPIITIAMSRPVVLPPEDKKSPSAQGETRRLEATFRAGYVLAASKRLAGLSGADLDRGLRAEQTYFNQHLAAAKKRQKAAVQVDSAAAQHGAELGWYAKMDSVTSGECRAANGKNFTPTRRPAIGFPGSVHPNCRCKAGPRHRTNKTVYDIKLERKKAA